MKDTAEEVGTLKACLHSTKCRAEIAMELLALEKWDLLPTILEDLYCGCQILLDNFCIVKEDK